MALLASSIMKTTITVTTTLTTMIVVQEKTGVRAATRAEKVNVFINFCENVRTIFVRFSRKLNVKFNQKYVTCGGRKLL
jgi:hypothetical protein